MHRPRVLSFWYRESPRPLNAFDMHDDNLTPGLADEDDPGRTTSPA